MLRKNKGIAILPRLNFRAAFFLIAGTAGRETGTLKMQFFHLRDKMATLHSHYYTLPVCIIVSGSMTFRQWTFRQRTLRQRLFVNGLFVNDFSSLDYSVIRGEEADSDLHFDQFRTPDPNSKPSKTR
uniref:Uncharacterized protein n=1 Tax=Globodera rostochiensis TaxID=31243 RepID=A0A914IAB2_GLORO